MEVHLTGNRVYTKRIDVAKGDPANPVTWQDWARSSGRAAFAPSRCPRERG